MKEWAKAKAIASMHGDEPGPGGLRAVSVPGGDTDRRTAIFFEAGNAPGYVATCDRSRFEDRITCVRRLALRDGLALTYRFDGTLLPNWGRLDRRLQEFVLNLKAK
ncbi:hypothetical protein GCM10011316_34460 [Roseibium aquae]|uniref:Uncharacterized protein n=2 Tax=Roseibium aquae TaxID=1323746 RepID=A0A916X254_9HYPH|nr:hypothetical protein GCM10011316_34460 [Roseibium aquae]